MGSPFSEGGLGGAGVNDYSRVQRGTSVLEESSRGNKLGSCLGNTSQAFSLDGNTLSGHGYDFEKTVAGTDGYLQG